MKTRITNILALLVLLLWLLPAQADDEDETPVPEELQALIDQLPEEKREFLMGEDADGFMGTRERLYERMEGMSLERLEAYVDGMMTVAESALYNAETDMASLPLNTESEWFNSWKVMRPRSLNREREAGPIHLSYYDEDRYGVRTFAGAPLAIYPEDLVAGNVDVAIVGAPLDLGSYHRGQRFGPAAMRNEYGIGGVDMYTMVNPSKELTIVDYGDIAVDNYSAERTVHHVRERVREIAESGAIPFIVGGDHSLEYPNIAALADVHGKGSFGAIHFDSHYDAGKDYPYYMTHGQPVYRAIKEGHIEAEHFIQIGLRGPWPSKDGFEWMRNNGMRYHTMPEIVQKGWEEVMETALKEAREGGRALYISFDVDVLDPSVTPGTGTPVPGGLTMREAIPIVRRLCAENDLVGFDLVELAPNLDPTYRSTLNANFILHACLTGVAMRKKGITQVGFLSELTTEHQQPKAGRKGVKEELTEEIDPNYGRPPE